jgi:hypothetical protein
MRRYCPVALFAAVAAALLWAGPGNAVSINNGSGLPAPPITFSGAPPDELPLFSAGTSITDQFSSLGVTFSTPPDTFVIYQDPAPGQLDGIQGNHLSNNLSANPFSIRFTVPQTNAAFALATAPTPGTVFEALYQGNPVPNAGEGGNSYFVRATAKEYNGLGEPIGPYFGFTGVTFDEIRIYVGADFPGDSTGAIEALIDNIQLGQAPDPEVGAPPVATPEPTTLLLVGTTAGGMGLVRWHRRRRGQ